VVSHVTAARRVKSNEVVTQLTCKRDTGKPPEPPKPVSASYQFGGACQKIVVSCRCKSWAAPRIHDQTKTPRHQRERLVPLGCPKITSALIKEVLVFVSLLSLLPRLHDAASKTT
ncbi:unnamed protein product, partial [Ectocarpus sp. 13 AM-2016]